VIVNQLYELIKDEEGYVTLENFQKFIETVFVSKISDRIDFTFRLFDFNKDEKVSKEEVKLLLAYSNLSSMIEEEKNRQKNSVLLEGKLKHNKFLDFVFRMS